MNWQPIETAPKDGTAVILYGGIGCLGFIAPKNMKEFPISICFWDTNKGQWIEATGEQYQSHDFPTHWAEFPAPP